MSQHEVRRSYHRVVTTLLVLVNLAAVAYAVVDGGAATPDSHFRRVTFIHWLGGAQMFGASLLFLACYFAARLVPRPGERLRDQRAWIVFSLGFFLLALDQQFLMRETVTIWLEGGLPAPGSSSLTFTLLKLFPLALAVVLVALFRATVLANFHMTIALLGGFWFLLFMLLSDVMLEALVGRTPVVVVIEGTAKLLAMAMFLSASFAALLDRMDHARAQLTASSRGVRDTSKIRVPPDALRRQGDVDFSQPTATPTPEESPDPQPALDKPAPGADEPAPAEGTDQKR